MHYRPKSAWVVPQQADFPCRALPSSLLLLSRAFTVTQPLESPSEDAPFESLKETISSLPNKVWHSVLLKSLYTSHRFQAWFWGIHSGLGGFL